MKRARDKGPMERGIQLPDRLSPASRLDRRAGTSLDRQSGYSATWSSGFEYRPAAKGGTGALRRPKRRTASNEDTLTPTPGGLQRSSAPAACWIREPRLDYTTPIESHRKGLRVWTRLVA